MNDLQFHLIMQDLRSRLKEGRLTAEQFDELRYGWEVLSQNVVGLDQAALLTGRSERTLYQHIHMEHALLPARVVGRGSAIWRPALYIMYPELSKKDNRNGNSD